MEKYKVNGQMTDQGAQRREEQLAAVGEKILKASRSALYLKMRFLDVALWSFTIVRKVWERCTKGIRFWCSASIFMRSCMEFSAI